MFAGMWSGEGNNEETGARDGLLSPAEEERTAREKRHQTQKEKARRDKERPSVQKSSFIAT